MKKKYIFFMLLALLALTGCGRSLVITTGFGRDEVFRIGRDSGRAAELRVYLLDLQKEHEALFGEALWEGGESGSMQQALKDQALAQAVRVKALYRMGVNRNVMLTTEEERRAEEAEHVYYAGLSGAEKKYIDLDEKKIQRMFREYALAEKTWRSLGEGADQAYSDFYQATQCDLNKKYWQAVVLKKIEGDPEAPGFARSYRQNFPEPETEAEDARPESGAEGDG